MAGVGVVVAGAGDADGGDGSAGGLSTIADGALLTTGSREPWRAGAYLTTNLGLRLTPDYAETTRKRDYSWHLIMKSELSCIDSRDIIFYRLLRPLIIFRLLPPGCMP